MRQGPFNQPFPTTKVTPPDDALAQGLAAYKAGALDTCINLLAPLVKDGQGPGTALVLLGQCHARLDRLAEAAECYNRAAEVMPENRPLFLLMAARFFQRVEQHERALQVSRAALADVSDDIELRNTHRRSLRAALCVTEAEASDQELLIQMAAGDARALSVDDPYEHLLWCGDEAINARQRRMPVGRPFTASSRAARRSLPRPKPGDGRLRIGYLSADFSDQHPTMRLLQTVLLGHDPDRFDIHLLCHTSQAIRDKDRGGRAAFGQIHDLLQKNDDEAANIIRGLDLHVLVDLKGHTKDVRVDLINRGLARLQVAYLGFPGTSHGIDCDYVIGDRIVTPDAAAAYFHEKFCRLPDSYQANDNYLRPRPGTIERASLGLPDQAFVLASFNMVRKINAPVLRLFARILQAVPRAILWQLCSDGHQQARLTDFLAAEGVGRERIVFAAAADYPAHITRLAAADLGLDTFPYNGHTTTSDKLWAGLPVVTLKGSNFASRVSESLLTAVGLPDLVADSADDLVNLVCRLAADPQRYRALRQRLCAARDTAPLFDTQRFTRHLEQAYQIMVERDQAGQEPGLIDVPALNFGYTPAPETQRPIRRPRP